MRRLPDQAARWVGAHRHDLAVAAFVAVAAAAYHLATAAALPSSEHLAWFGADTARVSRHMSVRAPMLDRSQFHPLFPLLAQTPARALRLVGIDRLWAIRVVIAAWSASGSAALYGLARTRRWPPGPAVGVAALVTTSGAWTFFGAMPETYGVGSAAVAVALLAVLRRPTAPPPAVAAGAVVVASAATVTGFVAPTVAFWRIERRWSRRALVVAGGATVAIVLLAVQHVLFGTRLLLTLSGESEFLRDDPVRGTWQSVRTLVLDSWATPAPGRTGGEVTFAHDGWTQGSLQWAAVPVLVALVVLVVRGAWRHRRDPLVAACSAGLAAQVGLAAVYGDEPFLASAMLVPLVGGLVVAAGRGRNHRVLATVCWAAAPVLAAVNVVHLVDAARLL